MVHAPVQVKSALKRYVVALHPWKRRHIVNGSFILLSLELDDDAGKRHTLRLTWTLHSPRRQIRALYDSVALRMTQASQRIRRHHVQAIVAASRHVEVTVGVLGPGRLTLSALVLLLTSPSHRSAVQAHAVPAVVLWCRLTTRRLPATMIASVHQRHAMPAQASGTVTAVVVAAAGRVPWAVDTHKPLCAPAIVPAALHSR